MANQPRNNPFNRKFTSKTPGAYKIFRGVLCTILVGALFIALPVAQAQPAQVLSAGGGYVPDEVLVKVSGDVSSSQRKTLGKVGKVTDSGMPLSDGSLLVVKVPEGTVPAAIKELKDQPGVIYAEPNYYAYAMDVIPNDPAWPSQYGLRHINAPAAWSIAEGSVAVTIAVLDSGVDFHQPDLAPKLVQGYDYVNNDTNPQDDFGHGTMVAGIAAASTNNCLGVAGTSWGARIMPVKVLNFLGGGTFANVALGIYFAADHGARVINMSLGGPTGNETLQNAVDYAVNNGVVVVAAAGNSYGGPVFFPGAYSNVVAVSATNLSDQIANFSAQGKEVDLAAPGEDIISDGLLANGQRLVTESGTSFSAPFVSGAAAILLGIPGNNFSSDVIRQMETTAKDLGSPGFDYGFGNGLLQLDAAVKLAIQEHPLEHPLKKIPGEKCQQNTPPPGPSSTPEVAAIFGGGMPGGSGAPLTPTATPTATSTATSTSTSTATATSTATLTQTATPVGALAVKPTSPPVAALPTPPMPALAGFFLLAGMGLIGYALVLRRTH